MAIFRKIHTQLWSDPFFSELDTEKKLFYIYLLTNEKTKQCGIYEISKKHICFDLNISLDKVNKLLNFFISKGKLQFSDSSNELAIKNWKKYNYSTSPKVVKCIESELKLVKNRVLIEYIYSIDTLSQEEEEKEEVNVPAFLLWFNNSLLKYKNKLGKNQILTQTDINNLKKLKKANYTKEDFEHAFKVMVNNTWVIQNSMWKPSHFLVADNFQKYLNTEIDENKPKFAWQ
jgi:hypothetical protein